MSDESVLRCWLLKRVLGENSLRSEGRRLGGVRKFGVLISLISLLIGVVSY